ncbi:Phenylacetate-coenzyme A ligase [Polaromonas sp. CG9_12]|nr:Phenylacetate-coenzyme A ligase [Polaromonas sp. CG9_12]
MDALETRAPAEREAALLAALPAQIAHARSASSAFAQILAGIDPAAITSRTALAMLPVTRKSDLLARQQAGRAENVFGGFSTLGFGAAMPRVFSSPGPMYEPEGTRRDYWRMARALYAAGFRPGELAHNSFSYHFVPAGSMMENGAHALGCTVFPGGTGQTEQQVQAMAELKPAGYIGTPSFLKIIVEKAAEMKITLPSVTKALVSPKRFRPACATGWQRVALPPTSAMPPLTWGLPMKPSEGLVIDEGVIVEIVRPGTGDPVREGEVGELVVTTLNPVYPLIRFGTGDLSAVLPGHCPSGRTTTPHQRLDGPGRPDHQGARHVRASGAGRRDCPALSRSHQGTAGGQRRDGERQHEPAGRDPLYAGRAGPAHRRRDPRCHQAARQGRAAGPGSLPTTARSSKTRAATNSPQRECP